MIRVTAKDLLNEQNTRLRKMKQLEDDMKCSEDAKHAFHRPPYYLAYKVETPGHEPKETS